MATSATRVAARHLGTLTTPAWLLALADYAEQHENSEAYVPTAARLLRSLAKSVSVGNMEAPTVEDVWAHLTERDTDPIELRLLQRRPPPRPPRAPHRVPFQDAMRAFEQAADKSVVWSLWLDDPDVDQWSAPLLAWAKAVKGLSRFRRAHNLFKSEVRKINVGDKSVGTEEASWRAGGVLFLSLRAGAAAATDTLVHEMGHALEDKLGLLVVAGGDTPYGQPPFVSSMAEVNAAEDFAETFRALETEPHRLQQMAPTKYDDMRERAR